MILLRAFGVFLAGIGLVIAGIIWMIAVGIGIGFSAISVVSARLAGQCEFCFGYTENRIGFRQVLTAKCHCSEKKVWPDQPYGGNPVALLIDLD